MNWRQWLRSFQARSIAASTVVCLVLWGGVSTWAFVQAHLENSQAYDREMRVYAEVVLKSFPGLETTDSEPVLFDQPSLSDPETFAFEFNFQVWSHDRRLLARASTTPKQPLNPDFTPGYSSRDLNGSVWRVYALSDASGRIQVQVGQTVEQRVAEAKLGALDGLAALPWLLGPLTLGLVVMSLWTARPLRKLRDSVAGRRPGDDGALPETGLPSETVPLVIAFNGLLRRTAQAREAQQRFVGDAAHELRTPLAALRVQAQVAMRTRDAAQRNAALARLVEGIDRTARVTEQLLDLARMDSLQAEAVSLRNEPVNLAVLVARTVDGSRILAERRCIQVRTQVETLIVSTDSELLGIALRNVIDNALRYSPPDACVDVVASRQAGSVHLSVIDGGLGLSPEQRQQALQPFVRLGHGDEYGSGLGLSIVQRVSALLGIGFELLDAPSGRGLEARFTLTPRAKPL